MLHGLKTEYFNGNIGIINSGKENGRYQVMVRDGSVKNLKAENLKNIPVMLTGLQKGTQYNGLKGYVSSRYYEGRYEVKVSNETIEKRIKPENLEIIKYIQANINESPDNLDSLHPIYKL